MVITMTYQDPETIWLQPWCEKCQKESWGANEGRQWCEDKVWDQCDLCERKPVRYIIDVRSKRRTPQESE